MAKTIETWPGACNCSQEVHATRSGSRNWHVADSNRCYSVIERGERPQQPGVSAGIDLTLRFISEVAGADAAGKVQFASEYYPSPVTDGDYTGHAQAPGYVRAIRSG